MQVFLILCQLTKLLHTTNRTCAKKHDQKVQMKQYQIQLSLHLYIDFKLSNVIKLQTQFTQVN